LKNIESAKSHLPEQGSRRNVFAFSLILVTGILVYRQTFSFNIILADSYDLLFYYQKYGLSGIQFNFFDPMLNPVSNILNFSLFQLIADNSSGWIFFAFSLHVLNSFLVYLISEKLVSNYIQNKSNSFFVSILASGMFLLSPYQTEAVLWAPRQTDFVIATAFALTSIYFMMCFFKTPITKYVLLLHLFYLLAILSFESPLPLPGIFVAYFLVLLMTGKTSITFIGFFKKILLPNIIIIVSYFLLSKIWLGTWIPHYGAKVHLNFSIQILTDNIIKYLAKFFLFYRYLPASRHDFLQQIFFKDTSNVVLAFSFWILVLSIVYFAIKMMLRIKLELKFMMVFLFLSFIFLLLPVINLDTSFLGAIISDRYGYLPSAVFYIFLSFLFYFLFSRTWKIVSFLWILGSTILLLQTFPLWENSGDYCTRLTNNFKPYLATNENIYILNMPDNINWVLTARSGFASYIYLHFHSEIRPRSKIIATYYMSDETDSVVVLPISEKQFLVSGSRRKMKFLNDGVWASSYKTSEFKVDFDKAISSYKLTFDSSPVNPLYLYVSGDKWKQAKVLRMHEINEATTN